MKVKGKDLFKSDYSIVLKDRTLDILSDSANYYSHSHLKIIVFDTKLNKKRYFNWKENANYEVIDNG